MTNLYFICLPIFIFSTLGIITWSLFSRWSFKKLCIFKKIAGIVSIFLGSVSIVLMSINALILPNHQPKTTYLYLLIFSISMSLFIILESVYLGIQKNQIDSILNTLRLPSKKIRLLPNPNYKPNDFIAEIGCHTADKYLELVNTDERKVKIVAQNESGNVYCSKTIILNFVTFAKLQKQFTIQL